MEGVRVRFAPSPTGFAHIGNIRNAVFDWLLAQHSGGKFILRIEDTDRARIVPGAVEEIMESLRWLGMQWDEGPEVGGPYRPYFQSERLDQYKEYADRLLEQQAAYYCFCTPERLAEVRKQQEARKMPTGYDRRCLALSPSEVAEKLAEGVPAALRFKVPTAGQTSFTDVIRGEIGFENKLLDDFVILKSDGYPTYHFASVVDDHLMSISHIIRSEEWISSTPKHILLYAALGWDPPKFAHPPLILGPDRTKLSKRHGAVRFLDYKEKGFLPEAMINFMTLLAWSPGEDRELFTVGELVERFTLDGVVNHPVVFDYQKLEWMNGVYVRGADLDRIVELCMPFMQDAGCLSPSPSEKELAYAREAINLVRDRMRYLAQVVKFTDFFFAEEPEYEEKGVKKWLRKDYVPELLGRLVPALEGLADFRVEDIEERVRTVGDEMGLSGGTVIHPIRVAVTGRMVGPGLFETMAVLGKDRILGRLRRTLGFISAAVQA